MEQGLSEVEGPRWFESERLQSSNDGELLVEAPREVHRSINSDLDERAMHHKSAHPAIFTSAHKYKQIMNIFVTKIWLLSSREDERREIGSLTPELPRGVPIFRPTNREPKPRRRISV